MKQNDYMVRIYEEMKQVSKSCFVTLTYRESSVPYLVKNGKKYYTVWKPDITDWIKRFRTNYERKTGIKGIRYFLCSEYGPKTHRPHYHAIFFGLSKSDLELALNDWYKRFGFTSAKDVDYTAPYDTVARYVSKYACKGVFDDPFRFPLKPSETFSQVFKRFRQILHLSNDVLPFVFEYSPFPPFPVKENLLDNDYIRCVGYPTEFLPIVSDFVFRRGSETEKSDG